MRKVWILILLSSIGTLLFLNPSDALVAMTKGSHDAVKLSMSLVALYAFWMGFFAILEKTGLAAVFAKLLRPIVKFLFPGVAEETEKYITMNISANILGLGGAATPMAIQAINSMEARDGDKASINMIMLVVIASTSLQILPTTVIGLRASHGSANPTDFLLPCIIATITSTILGIFLVKMLWLSMKRKSKSAVAKASKTEKTASSNPQNKLLGNKSL